MDKQRRFLLGFGCASLISASAALSSASSAAAENGGNGDNANDVLANINTRRSVRAYTTDPVTDEDLNKILSAAMMAPSAANEQPWEFVVIRDPDLLTAVGEINHYASFARKAPVAILLCLNEEKEKIKGMAILDMGMAAENLMLAAHALGIGSVFTGIYPMEDRIKKFQELVGLPATVIPIGLIVMGYPEIKTQRTAPERFRKEAIHINKWQGQ